MEKPKEITLERLLRSRDARYARQLEWVRDYPGVTLVCLTVVLPGPVKRDRRSLAVAERGVAAIREMFRPLKEECLDLETGFEGYFLVEGGIVDVKRACCRIEEEDPMGRLMDIDVLEPVGDTVVPVGRDRLGLEERRCLLCDRPARECMRAHTHSQQDIFAKIDEIVNSALNL